MAKTQASSHPARTSITTESVANSCESLNEEKAADKTLASLAESGINNRR